MPDTNSLGFDYLFSVINNWLNEVVKGQSPFRVHDGR